MARDIHGKPVKPIIKTVEKLDEMPHKQTMDGHHEALQEHHDRLIEIERHLGIHHKDGKE